MVVLEKDFNKEELEDQQYCLAGQRWAQPYNFVPFLAYMASNGLKGNVSVLFSSATTS